MWLIAYLSGLAAVLLITVWALSRGCTLSAKFLPWTLMTLAWPVTTPWAILTTLWDASGAGDWLADRWSWIKLMAQLSWEQTTDLLMTKAVVEELPDSASLPPVHHNCRSKLIDPDTLASAEGWDWEGGKTSKKLHDIACGLTSDQSKLARLEFKRRLRVGRTVRRVSKASFMSMTRGDIGKVVEVFPDGTFTVEFQGRCLGGAYGTYSRWEFVTMNQHIPLASMVLMLVSQGQSVNHIEWRLKQAEPRLPQKGAVARLRERRASLKASLKPSKELTEALTKRKPKKAAKRKAS